MRLVSIDPGFAQDGGTAFAQWTDGVLTQARLVRSTLWGVKVTGLDLWLRIAHEVSSAVGEDGSHAVIELPRTYGGRAKVGDANTLIQLGALVGALANALARSGAKVELISVPKVPKSVTEGRVRAILSPAELKLVDAAAPRSLRHNIYDACGIGLRVQRRVAV